MCGFLWGESRVKWAFVSFSNSRVLFRGKVVFMESRRTLTYFFNMYRI